jgi:hypothetical protein
MILPVVSPSDCTTSTVEGAGAAIKITSHCCTAKGTEVKRSSPISVASFIFFSLRGSRAPTSTVCPAFIHFLASAPPTLPEPMMAIVMWFVFGLNIRLKFLVLFYCMFYQNTRNRAGVLVVGIWLLLKSNLCARKELSAH